MEFSDNRIGGSGPLERFAILVVGSDEVVDSGDELLDTAKRAAPNGFVGNQCKEALNLIEPGAVRGDEVHVPVRPVCQPVFDTSMLVRGVIVNDDMNVEFGRHSFVDGAQGAAGIPGAGGAACIRRAPPRRAH